MATAKKAAPRKSTAKKKLPHVKAKDKAVVVRATYEKFGRDDWRLIRPNQIIMNEILSAGDDEDFDVTKLNGYLASHLHPDDRKDFFDAAMDDPTMDIDQLEAMLEEMTEAVFADMAGDAKG